MVTVDKNVEIGFKFIATGALSPSMHWESTSLRYITMGYSFSSFLIMQLKYGVMDVTWKIGSVKNR